MTLYYSYLCYPEGDIQETQFELRINQVVDINGNKVKLPLSTHKVIIYRVYRISEKEERGEVKKYYFLEQIKGQELFSMVRE